MNCTEFQELLPEEFDGGPIVDQPTVETRKELAAPQEKLPYDDTAFTKNFPSWEKLIAAGKKSAADVIAAIETKNTLTQAQRDDINCIAPPPEPQQ